MTPQAPTATIPATPIKSLPAGGPNPKKFDWKEAWHPLFYTKDLKKDQPNRFTLLDQDLVIWWEAKTQKWRCFQDQCPHRLAPLSEGRINAQGQLECPYHGWSFSGEGNCEHIPQQVVGAKAETSRRACAKSLPVALHQDMLFVYPGNPENAEQVEIPSVGPIEDQDPNWVIIDTFRDVPYDALTLLENVLDPSHLPYTPTMNPSATAPTLAPSSWTCWNPAKPASPAFGPKAHARANSAHKTPPLLPLT